MRWMRERCGLLDDATRRVLLVAEGVAGRARAPDVTRLFAISMRNIYFFRGETPMDEFSVNRLASMLDCDRQTLVRALKDTPADAGSERKPLFRVSTAVAALERHRGKPDGRRRPGNGVAVADMNHDLQRMFVRLDDLRDKIENAATLKERREIMRKQFFPLLLETRRAMIKDGKAIAENDVWLTLRVAEHERLQLVTLRAVCGWNTDEVLAE
jgi:hypothetical protein